MDLEGIELLHAIPGRVRLRVPEMKGNPELAREIQAHLSSIKLVHRSEANPVTGSVLILYDSADSASITALGRAAFPDVNLDGDPTLPEPTGSPCESSTESIRGFFRDLNARVGTATGGTDLRVLLPTALFLMGVKNLMVGKRLAAPQWYDYLWFAFGTFFTLNGAARTSPQAASSPPPASTAAPVHVNGTA